MVSCGFLIQQFISFGGFFNREAMRDPFFGFDSFQGFPGRIEAAGFIPASG